MPIIKSARKRVRVAEKATVRNAKTKRQLKRSFKSFGKKITNDSFRDVQSSIDQAAKKHVIHKNKAARLKRRAAKIAKEANLKPVKSSVKQPAKKTTKTAVTKAKTTTKKK